MSPRSTPRTAAVERAAAALRHAEEDLRESVRVARASGATWQEIADSLGVTRQSAFKRFGHDIDPQTERPASAPTRLDAGALAGEVAGLLAAGDLDGVHARMTQACARALGKRVLRDFREDLIDVHGPLERVVFTSSHDPDGSVLEGPEVTPPAVGRAVVQHAHSTLVAHATVNRHGRITGLTIRLGEAESWPL